MLNLRPIFVDALEVFSEFGNELSINSLPAAVYMMQLDVVNHYEYALTHYFPLTLNEDFLKNSSIFFLLTFGIV